MAGNLRGITVEIGGDTSKLNKALENSEKTSKKLQTELKQVNTALKFNPSNVELLAQKQRLLSEQIQATTEKLNVLKEAEAQVTAQFEAGEIGEEQFRAFQREIIETESKLKTYQSQLEATAQKSSALDELTSTISKQEAEVEKLKNEYKEAVLTYGKNSDEAKKLANEIESLSTELKENKQTMKDLDREADELDHSLDEVGDSAEQASGGFTVMKGALANLVADGIRRAARALMDLAKTTLETGMNFESSMANVAALSGATGDELQKLEDTARHFGETTVFSASEAADALGYMALAGWDADQSIEGLPGVLDLAAASGMGLAEASDMVTDYLSAFGLEAKDAAQFADQLAYAQANSNTSAAQLGEAFKNCAANMNAAGQDVETTTSLLEGLANQGLKGSEAGTALAAMMRDLTNRMKDGAISIGDTSVAVQDSQGNFRDMTDILKDVAKATEGMGTAEKAAALAATFTADSIKGVNLILNEGVDTIAGYEEELRNCDGAAKAMSDTMNDTVAGALKQLQSNVEGKMITVFKSASDSLKGSIKSMSAALNTLDWDKIGEGVGNFARKISELFEYVVNHADGIKTALGAIAAVIGTTFAVNKIATFTNSIKTLAPALTGLAAKVGIVTTATNAAGASTLALNAAWLASPVTWVVAGFAALAIAIGKATKEKADAIEATYGLSDAEKELITDINLTKQAYEDANRARLESNQSIEAEYGQIQNLWNELQTIVDANGKVKKGYEDRAAVITGLLSEALGQEIQLVDGQIQSYDELKGSIQEVIDTKKAEALLEANKEAYTEAVRNSATAYKQYSDAVKDAGNTRKELQKAEEEAAAAQETLTKGYHLQGESVSALNQQYLDAQAKVDKLKEKYNEQKQAVSDAEQTYLGYANTIEQYEGVMAALASGDVEALSQAMANLSNNFLTAENATREMLENQLSNFQEQYAAMKEAVDAGMPGVTQAQVDAMKQLVDQADAELKKLEPKAREDGQKSGKAHAEGVKATSDENRTAGKNVSDKTNEGMGTADTKTTGKKKGDDFASGVDSTSGAANTAGKKVTDNANAGMGTADAKGTGIKKGNEFASGVDGTTAAAMSSGKKVSEGAKSGAGAVNFTPTGSEKATQFNKGIDSRKGAANTSGKNIATSAKSGAGSVDATGSGSNFAQGFINGIGSLVGRAFSAAYNLARQAWAGLKRGQSEGSPSKLTYQSGEYFDQGYINAINDGAAEAAQAAEDLAKSTVTAINKALGSSDVQTTGTALGASAAQAVIKGVDAGLKKDKSGKVTKTLAEIQKSYVSQAKSRLTEMEKANQITLSEEVKYWEEIVKHIDKGTTAYDSAISQLTIVKNKAGQASEAITADYVKSAKTQIGEMEKTNDITKYQESLFWNSITKTAKEGTDGYKSAVSELNTVNKNIQDSLNKLADSYGSSYTKISDTLKSAVEKANEDYWKDIDSKASSLFNAYKLSEAVKDAEEPITKGELITNLKDQVTALDQYGETLEKLNERIEAMGGYDAFQEEIANLGVKDLDTLKAIASMSDSELTEYMDLYERKWEDSYQGISTYVVDGLKKTRDTTISEAKKTAAESMAEISKTWADGLKELGIDTSKLSFDIGADIVGGLDEGITEYMGRLTEKFSLQVEGLVDTAKNVLGIHSPSKVFENQIGKMLPPGISDGFASAMPKAERSIKSALSKMVDSLSDGDMFGGITDALNGVDGLAFNRSLDSTFNRSTGFDFTEILDKLDAVSQAIQTYSGNAIVLDTGVLVGQTINKIDSGLADTYALKARGI